MCIRGLKILSNLYVLTGSFESRYIFRNVDEFPPPQPYQNIVKFYNSKFQGKYFACWCLYFFSFTFALRAFINAMIFSPAVAKQQAPKPPMQLHTNRVWPPCENTSNC